MKKLALLFTVLAGCYLLFSPLKYPKAYSQKYPEMLTRIALLPSINLQRCQESVKHDYETFVGLSEDDNQKAYYWAKIYGGPGDDKIRSITKTADGDFIIGATEFRSFAPDRSYSNWLFKLSKRGEIRWERVFRIKGGRNEETFCVKATDDGGCIVGGNYVVPENTELTIIKLLPDGEVEWSYTYPQINGNTAHSIQQTIDGGYIVVGLTGTFNALEKDLWVLKLSSRGEVEWDGVFGGPDLEADWYNGRRVASAIQVSDGGYVVACDTHSFGAGWSDIWIIKLSKVGDIEWQRTYGGKESEWLYYSGPHILETRDGGLIVAGETLSFGAGGNDAWIMKLTKEGDVEWQHTYGGERGDRADAIRQAYDGGYIVAGSTVSFGSTEGNNFWLLKISEKGKIIWERTYGPAIRLVSFEQADEGGYVLIGSTGSQGAQGEDILVLKVSLDGNIGPACEIVKNSNAVVMDTHVLPQDTEVERKTTEVERQRVKLTTQDTNASIGTICLWSESLPNAPKSLRAKAITRQNIRLRWKDKSNDEDGFFIERRSDTSGTWEMIKKISRNAKKYTDKRLEADKLYYYRVRAFNSNGYSDYSNVAEARTKKQ